MNSNNQVKNVLPKWSVLLVLLMACAVAWAGGPPKSSGGGGGSRPSAPSRPASAPKAAPAQRPSGGSNGQRPGASAGSNNRGPGGSAQNRGPGGNAQNRGPGGNAQNRGPGGSAQSRGAGGANASKGSQANAGKGGQANASKGGQANAGKGGQANASKGGQANAGKGGAAGGNKGGAANASKGGAAGAGHHQPAGSKTVGLKNGGSATFRRNGQVRSISAHGMTINHGMHGNTRITSTHNGRTVVSEGRHGGYSQRGYYNHGGRSYVQRTYYSGGRSYAYGYRSYSYGGYPYYGYAPSFYYGPAYYGWAYNPWAAPVAYGWGWGGSPWFGFYGPYFAPYPVYAGAAFWLTDYLIAANLQAAYADQQGGDNGGGDDNGGNGELSSPPLGPESADEIASLWSTDPLVAANLEAAYGVYMLGGGAPAAAAKSGATGMTPEVKKAIADEMKNEIAAEKDAAASGQKDAPSGDQVPAALDPKIRYFVVSSEEDLTTSDGAECALTAGDVVYRKGDTPDDDHMVDATVKSGKKDECAAGATVAISVDDLQEMHNQLRIQMDAGLKELASKQGKNGLPAAPDTKTQAGEVPAPTPDTSVSSDLQQQKKDAAQVEAEAKQQQ
jgi:hypothetical protein